MFTSLIKLLHVRNLSQLHTMSKIKYLSQEEAIKVDQELFKVFSVDQLMELAGLSVATAIAMEYPPSSGNSNVLICCGPGNNGGDGLVAARHLKLFGFEPRIVYPKPGKGDLFERLTKQCHKYGIPVDSETNSDSFSECNLIVDAIFGFSYKPPLRPQFKNLLTQIAHCGLRVISVDIPSGWIVDEGPPTDESTPVIQPDCLISLTAPKLCARQFKGSSHYLGGRFIPECMDMEYNLGLPRYEGTDVCVKLIQ